MPLDDCKSSIELFEQNHACQFVRQGHLAKREDQVGAMARLLCEPVRRPDRKDQRLGPTHLVSIQHLGQFFRCKLTSTLVEQDKRGRRLRGIYHPQQRILARQLRTFYVARVRQPVDIFLSERLDGSRLRLPDPDHLQFHGEDLTIEDAENAGDIDERMP